MQQAAMVRKLLAQSPNRWHRLPVPAALSPILRRTRPRPWLLTPAVAAILSMAPSVVDAQPAQQALQVLGSNPLPPLYRQALETYFNAEDAYRKHDYAAADRFLQALWAQVPPGDVAWKQMRAASLPLLKVADFGTPPAYAALRMLTACVAWRLAPQSHGKPQTVQWTVVLLGQATRTAAAGGGDLGNGHTRQVTHTLDTALTDDVLTAGAWLFEEYVQAMTLGQVRVKRVVVRLPDFDLPVELRPGGVKVTRAATERVWNAVPQDVAKATHWWHIVYPSHVPKGEAFVGERFVTGGMRAGPRGHKSPCFLSEDLKFLRAPNQDGRHLLTDAERRVALAQWFQHEFFHYVFAAYPQLGLEATPHQWHDRATWPADFAGRTEADYYAEALAKRLQAGVTPPLGQRFLQK